MNELLQRAKDEVAKTRTGYYFGGVDHKYNDWDQFLYNANDGDVICAWEEVAELYAKYSREDLENILKDLWNDPHIMGLSSKGFQIIKEAILKINS